MPIEAPNNAMTEKINAILLALRSHAGVSKIAELSAKKRRNNFFILSYLSLKFFMTLAGTPATRVKGGTSCVTTLPAAT